MFIFHPKFYLNIESSNSTPLYPAVKPGSSSYASVASISSSQKGAVAASAHSNPAHIPKIPLRIPNPAKELGELGRFVEVDVNSATWKTLALYATNSFQQSGSKLGVEVQKVYRMEPTKPSISKAFKNLTTKLASNSNFEMILWVKTTSDSIRKLAQSQNSCTAFYDRLSRALPLQFGQTTENWRQLILLCKVTDNQLLSYRAVTKLAIIILIYVLSKYVCRWILERCTNHHKAIPGGPLKQGHLMGQILSKEWENTSQIGIKIVKLIMQSSHVVKQRRKLAFKSLSSSLMNT